LCTLRGHRLSSEEVCNEYAAQTMFCQSQAFMTEKSQKRPYFVWLFFIPKKSVTLKKAGISKSGFKKGKLATLA